MGYAKYVRHHPPINPHVNERWWTDVKTNLEAGLELGFLEAELPLVLEVLPFPLFEAEDDEELEPVCLAAAGPSQ